MALRPGPGAPQGQAQGAWVGGRWADPCLQASLSLLAHLPPRWPRRQPHDKANVPHSRAARPRPAAAVSGYLQVPTTHTARRTRPQWLRGQPPALTVKAAHTEPAQGEHRSPARSGKPQNLRSPAPGQGRETRDPRVAVGDSQHPRRRAFAQQPGGGDAGHTGTWLTGRTVAAGTECPPGGGG